MPPQRTVPPSKAIKTERTHEENQERAYIAASRRSDRSLEARVESARRASEIHKRRTGRSLRVTEQDVVNEEMYEEEDDDLPMQYRRLTAHLQTGSADFNRRLSAYLTNHVAMRSALDQAITNSYAQQYPHAPQFAHNHHRMYPSPMMAHNMPQQQSATPYVQAPYNVATGTPGFRHVQHVRSTSMAGPLDASGYPQSVPSTASPGQSSAPGDLRRMSMPARTASSPGTSSAAQTSPFTQPKPPLQHAPSSYTGKQQMSSMLGATPGEQRKGQTEHQTPSPPQPQPAYGSLAGYPSFGPLSAALPVESQMFLGSVLDPNDPFTSMLMGGSENMMQPYYTSSPTALSKPSNFHPSYEGMGATLAPSALDMSPPNVASLPPATPGPLSTTPPLSLGYPDGLADFKGQVFTRSNSSHGSGTVTPTIDGGWDAFINDNSWSENPT